jgi:hypothetical protein
VKNQQSTTYHEKFYAKNRIRSNLGTRFLSSNGLGFRDFWSRTAEFQNFERFFSLKELYFQEESAIMFLFIDFQVTFLLPSI